jgi:glycosyltransferase involved in cell wall biosynthesis
MAMPSPEVSIIMPLYNAAAHVREAIGSILYQTYRDFELLVIDDGSTDDGPDIVRSFDDSRIRLIGGGANAGPASARNRGVSEARGRAIAFFDSDDIALPDMLGTVFGCIEGGYEIIAGWYDEIEGKGEATGRSSKSRLAPDKIASAMLFRNCIGTSGLLMKRECLDGQLFDESLKLASDYDMWARLIVGRRALLLPRVLVHYRSHPDNLTHRKADVAAGCLRHIYARQLTRLGIEASAEELELHARLGSFTVGTPQETVLAAERWLLKLDAANAATRVYFQGPFRETLGDYWYAVCHSAGAHGLWTLREYHDSPLAKWITPTAKQQYELMRLSARGAVKNLLPRREPPDASLPH